MLRYLQLIIAVLLLLTGLFGRDASAAELPRPAERPILTISGNIATTNREGAAVFDRAMLEHVGLEVIETSTPWHTGIVRFEGVRLDALMKLVGAKGTRVGAVALNDYTVDVPMEDFAEHGVILALKRDGAYMEVRDKGPLFIIYPFDAKPELKVQRFYSRCVWQLSRLVVK